MNNKNKKNSFYTKDQFQTLNFSNTKNIGNINLNSSYQKKFYRINEPNNDSKREKEKYFYNYNNNK